MSSRVAILVHYALQQPQHNGNEAARFCTARAEAFLWLHISSYVGTNDPLVHRQMRNRQIQRGGRNNENLEAKQVFT